MCPLFNRHKNIFVFLSFSLCKKRQRGLSPFAFSINMDKRCHEFYRKNAGQLYCSWTLYLAKSVFFLIFCYGSTFIKITKKPVIDNQVTINQFDCFDCLTSIIEIKSTIFFKTMYHFYSLLSSFEYTCRIFV